MSRIPLSEAYKYRRRKYNQMRNRPKKNYDLARIRNVDPANITPEQAIYFTHIIRGEGYPNYGGTMRKMRRDKGLTQLEVSVLTGVPRTKISEYEHCKRVPSVTNMKKLIKLYEPEKDLLSELMTQWEVMLLLRPQATRY